MSAKRTGAHILVLNDVAEILDLFEAILDDEGYRVSRGTMTPGEIGRTFQHVKEVKPDLLIADFLFGHDPLGWQLIQMLRMDSTTAALPIVVCSAAAKQVAELDSHLDEMGIGVVLKPFDVDTLLAEVDRILARAHGGQHGQPRAERADT
jgi:DNA-binding response OmpR family regulator